MLKISMDILFASFEIRLGVKFTLQTKMVQYKAKVWYNIKIAECTPNINKTNVEGSK
jgi:hypothetical protein